MAQADQVAATRVALALALVSDRIKVLGIDVFCVVTTAPNNALDGKFTDLGIDDGQMEFFRGMLAKECPEIASDIMDRANFPLAANMPISTVISTVEALLLNSNNWDGDCLPKFQQ